MKRKKSTHQKTMTDILNIKPDGTLELSKDLKFKDATAGVVLTDTEDETATYRLRVVNGNLDLERIT
jgi:hypothetical protein